MERKQLVQLMDYVKNQQFPFWSSCQRPANRLYWESQVRLRSEE
jgi:hypothetical protein